MRKRYKDLNKNQKKRAEAEVRKATMLQTLQIQRNRLPDGGWEISSDVGPLDKGRLLKVHEYMGDAPDISLFLSLVYADDVLREQYEGMISSTLSEAVFEVPDEETRPAFSLVN